MQELENKVPTSSIAQHSAIPQVCWPIYLILDRFCFGFFFGDGWAPFFLSWLDPDIGKQMSVGQQQRLPTLCEVDCQQELVNMAAAVLSAAVNNHNNRELQQQQLQQQQQQYAILLAQAVQQQQQAANLYSGSMMASHYNTPSPITPNQTSTSTFFQFQHPPAGSPAIYHHSPTSSYTQLNPMPGSTSSPSSHHRTAAQCFKLEKNGVEFHSSASRWHHADWRLEGFEAIASWHCLCLWCRRQPSLIVRSVILILLFFILIVA